MELQLNFFNVINTIRKTLNCIDEKITNHGDETAYIAYKLGTSLNLDEENLKSIVIAAMFHDIGACKTDDLSNIVTFENYNYKNHSIYGYLFFKYFSPLPHMSKSILYHHEDINHLNDTIEENYANLIRICDAVSVLKIKCSHYDEFEKNVMFEINDSKKYKQDYINTFIKLNKEESICQKLFDGSYLIELDAYLNRLSYTQDEVKKYIELLGFSIDFRSENTLTHSLTVSIITKEICSMLNFNEKNKEMCIISALLHDIGKISTPIEILKYPGQLSETDFKIMKGHVSKTREILEYLDHEKIKNIASNHHEKLNGKGYPRGLTEEMLTLEDRIIAVADIFSALTEKRYYKDPLPKDEVLNILKNCTLKHELDSNIVSLVSNHYDRILNLIEVEISEFNHKLEKIKSEHMKLLSQ